MHPSLTRFFEEHRERYPELNLPLSSDRSGRFLYETVGDEMTKLGIDYDAASAASRRLVLDPPAGRNKHWSKLLELAKEEMGRRPVGTARRPADISTREGAEAASKSCDRCGGVGLTTVYHPRPNPAEKIPATVAAYCVCAYGRWVKGNHAARCPDVAKRTPDLADAIGRRCIWLEEPPCEASSMT